MHIVTVYLSYLQYKDRGSQFVDSTPGTDKYVFHYAYLHCISLPCRRVMQRKDRALRQLNLIFLSHIVPHDLPLKNLASIGISSPVRTAFQAKRSLSTSCT